MHEILLKVQMLLEQAQRGPLDVPPAVEDEFVAACRASFRKQFKEPRDGFRMRMSNAGKPLCQLQMEKAGAPAEARGYAFKLQMLIGDMTEAALVSVLRLAGVKIEAVQKKVKLPLDNGRALNGSLDITIEGDDGVVRLWDIKSASPWSWDNKFNRGFEALGHSDSFGYVGQLYGYCAADRTRPGGWLAINKSTGELAVCEAPADAQIARDTVEKIRHNVSAVDQDAPFERCFDDIEETFRKKPSGNRYLGKTCEFCDFKFSCWPDLKYAPSAVSEAKNKPYHYYTVLTDADQTK